MMVSSRTSSLPVDAVIFAGGVGRRMGAGPRPKQFLELGGRPIIDYTVEHFATHPRMDGVVIACLADWIPYLKTYLSRRHYPVPIQVVEGGSTGMQSIFRSLDAVHAQRGEQDSVVLVHDGVRPLIDADTISRCISSVLANGPTATVAPAIETIVTCGDNRQVEQVLDRSQCRLARAPQGFLLRELYAAHLRAQQEGMNDCIDSITLMRGYGHTIYTVDGPAENIKVTTPADYYTFKGLMEARDQSALWRG